MKYHVKDWEKFQHYKNRKPPWIRLYNDLLDDPEYFALNGDDAKYLPLLWLIASEDKTLSGCLPDSKEIAFRFRMEHDQLTQKLARLSHFIVCSDSNPLASCGQVATPEERRGEENRGEERGCKQVDSKDHHSDLQCQAIFNKISGDTDWGILLKGGDPYHWIHSAIQDFGYDTVHSAVGSINRWYRAKGRHIPRESSQARTRFWQWCENEQPKKDIEDDDDYSMPPL